jgi:hypothetical protein
VELTTVTTIQEHPIIHAQAIVQDERAIEEVVKVQEDVVAQQATTAKVQQTKDVTLLQSKKNKALTIFITTIKDNLIPTMGDILEPIKV